MAAETSLVRPGYPSYRAAFSALVIVASATDVFELRSIQPPKQNKVVRIQRIGLSGLSTAIGAFHVNVIKRSSLNTVGTSTAATAVPSSSGMPAAGASFLGYTANPTTGTAVGTVMNGILATTPAATTTIAVPGLIFDFSVPFTSSTTLIKPTESFCISFATTTITGGAINCWIEWTEEANPNI